MTASLPGPHPDRRYRLAGALLGAVLLLSACGGPPKARLEEQQRQREFAARGYAPQGEAVTVQSLLWRMRGDDVRVSLALGAAAGPRPVVVYLPGLGESAGAGQIWQRTWASAGYAVLSIQPLEEDAAAWGSDLARSAEFNALGKRHYAEAEMRRRLLRLDELLAEAQRLSQAGDGPWRALDWSRTAVAGFELGAQSAMAMAGETASDGPVPALRRLQPQAFIVISPQVMAAPQPARYRGIRQPVLSITGPQDEDLLGMVQDTRWREAPFEAMSADLRWLLRINEVPHTALAGNAPLPGQGADREALAQNNASGQARRGARGAGGGRGDFGAQDRMQFVPNVPDWRQLHDQQLGLIAAQQISVAFLDLQLKQSERARAWLAGPAQGWLGRTGVLKGPAAR